MLDAVSRSTCRQRSPEATTRSCLGKNGNIRHRIRPKFLYREGVIVQPSQASKPSQLGEAILLNDSPSGAELADVERDVLSPVHSRSGRRPNYSGTSVAHKTTAVHQ